MAATLGARFAARHTNGFDYLRIGLALAVVAWHSITVSLGEEPGDAVIQGTAWVAVVRSIMPLFFALSGFLVASSLDRGGGLRPFLIARGLRIFPALVVEVIFSAFLLGPLFTTLPLGDYVSGRYFFSYLGNAVGWVHFLLPGVFLANPDAGIVNRSLWTVPSELECYALLSILFLLRATRSKVLIAAATVAYAVVATVLLDVATFTDIVIVWPRLLPLAFMAGVSAWKWRDSLPSGPTWGIAATILTIALMVDVRTTPLACLPAGYAAAALGCVDVSRNRILASGDYSYGVYLYAYPIQQVIVSLLGPRRPLLTFVMALVLIPAFAAFSWHAVEKHALKLKSRLVRPGAKASIPDHEPQKSGGVGR